MKYFEIFDKHCLNKPPLGLALATTGVSSTRDHLIGAWVSKDQFSVDYRMIEGLDIGPSAPYHQIPQELYDTDAVSRDEFIAWFTALLDSHTMVIYNKDFTMDFIQEAFGEVPVNLGWPIEIQKVERFISSRQTFALASSVSISGIDEVAKFWPVSGRSNIRKIISSYVPGWEVDETLPVPSSLSMGVMALYASLANCEILSPAAPQTDEPQDQSSELPEIPE